MEQKIKNIVDFDNCVEDFGHLFSHFYSNRNNLIDVNFTMQIVMPKTGKRLEGLYLIDMMCFENQYLKTFKKNERVKKEAEKLIEVCKSENITFVKINLKN